MIFTNKFDATIYGIRRHLLDSIGIKILVVCACHDDKEREKENAQSKM